MSQASQQTEALSIILSDIRDASWRQALAATAATWKSAAENADPEFGIMRGRLSQEECEALDSAILFNVHSYREAGIVRGALRKLWQT